MLLSMTGYGKYEKKSSNFDISVEIRSLNSRYIDIVSKVDDSIMAYENDIVSLIKEKCIRGKIYLTILLIENNMSAKCTTLNKNKLKIYIEKEKQLKLALNINKGLGIEFLIKQPDLLNAIIVNQTSTNNLFLNFSKEQEIEADFYAVETLNKLNLPKESVKEFLFILENKSNLDIADEELKKFSTHPLFKVRTEMLDYKSNEKHINFNHELENDFKLNIEIQDLRIQDLKIMF